MDAQFGIMLDREEIVSQEASAENKKSNDLFLWQYNAMKYFFSNNNCALYSVATGSGKSKLGVEILKEIWKKDPKIRALIVVPKNVILETGWYRELYEGGINISNIGVYYGAAKEYGKVTITNMQNLKNISIELFDCIILDEAHSYAAITAYREITKKEFKYKIGLTATIDRLDNEHWKILKYFNYNIFTYAPSDAIDAGIINTFDFINIGVFLTPQIKEEYDSMTHSLKNIVAENKGIINLKRNGGKPWFAYLKVFTQRKMLINNYPEKFDVAKAICEYHKKDKILVFNQFNDQTNKLKWHLMDVGINAETMHSGVQEKSRQERLSDFRMDRTNILLTTKMLDEGMNVPKADVAVILAADTSNRQLIQRMGRVLRKKDKKSFIYNVYCKETFEEKNVDKRINFYKALSSDYKDYSWSGKLE